jgi:CubicO group peptidase (beta-lactamase class C family)
MALPAFLLLLASPKPDLKSAVDKLIAREKDFNGSVLVARNGKTLYQRSLGVADRSFDVKVTAKTRFRIASMTKAFTSALVLQLVDEGKLNLEKSIKTYLPTYPGEGGDRITLRQLLNHTSGLPNLDASIEGYLEAERKGLDHYQRVFTPDGLVARWVKGPLRAQPGKSFDYNNGDYIVLGRIVEVTLKKPLEVVLRERILKPLRLNDTGLLTRRRIVKHLAPTYCAPDAKRGLELEIPIYAENWGGAGAMYSTTGDLARFADALFRGRLLRPATLKRMLTPGLDDSGFGVWVYPFDIKGRRYTAVKRPGGIMGANVELFHLREPGLTVIVLTNTNQVDTSNLGRKIAEAAL